MKTLIVILLLTLVPTTHAEEALGVFYAQSYRDLGGNNIRGQGGGIELSHGLAVGEISSQIHGKNWNIAATAGIKPQHGTGLYAGLQGGVGIIKDNSLVYHPVRFSPIMMISAGKKFTLEGEKSSFHVETALVMEPNYDQGARWPRWTLGIRIGWQGFIGQ